MTMQAVFNGIIIAAVSEKTEIVEGPSRESAE